MLLRLAPDTYLELRSVVKYSKPRPANLDRSMLMLGITGVLEPPSRMLLAPCLISCTNLLLIFAMELSTPYPVESDTYPDDDLGVTAVLEVRVVGEFSHHLGLSGAQGNR